MKAPSNEESKTAKNDSGVLGNDSSFDNNYWSSTNSLYNQNLQTNNLEVNNSLFQRSQNNISSNIYMRNNSFNGSMQANQGNTPKGNSYSNQLNNEFLFYSNPNKITPNLELSNFSNVPNTSNQLNLNTNNSNLQLNKTVSNASGPYLGSKYLYNNDSFKFPINKKEPVDTSITFSLSEKGISKVKKSKMLGILSCNTGLCEASTQTDLTMKDISNLEHINKVFKEYTFKETSNLNPHTISKFNSSIYNDVNKELKKTKIAKNIYFENKKIRKKYTIYANMLINNESSSIENNSNNNIINIYCDKEERGELYDIFGSANDDKPLSNENNVNTNFSNKSKNSLINSTYSNSFLKINDEIINKSKNQGMIKKDNHFHQHLKNNVTDQLQRIHKKIKNDKVKDTDFHSKNEQNKDKEQNSNLNLNEDKKLDDSISQKSRSQSLKNGSKPKLQKNNFDPFSFFLNELKGSNKELSEEELEKNAKEQWANMNKEMKKVYNLHADTEKKNQKKLKRKQNQSINNKISNEEPQLIQ